MLVEDILEICSDTDTWHAYVEPGPNGDRLDVYSVVWASGGQRIELLGVAYLHAKRRQVAVTPIDGEALTAKRLLDAAALYWDAQLRSGGIAN